jgi:hypothetical protein
MRTTLAKGLAALLACLAGACQHGTGPLAAGSPSQSAAPTGSTGVVLGSSDYWEGEWDEGFGSVAPKTLFNGGVPSGHIMEIRWRAWGSAVATGEAVIPTYRPSGGYYDEPVRAELRADRLGPCDGRIGYQRLLIRHADSPGGPLGAWYSWSQGANLCRPRP